MVLPEQGIGWVILVRQGQLVLTEFGDLFLICLAEELVLAVLDQLLLFASKQVEANR